MDFERKLGLNHKTVADAIERVGGKIDRHRSPLWFRPADMETAVTAYMAGESRKKIRKRLGITVGALNRLLLARGLPLEKRSFGRHSVGFRGGRSIDPSGYVLVLRRPEDEWLFPGYPPKRFYFPEHRLVAARTLGRPLAKNETVHHINGDRTDNRPENLQVRIGKHGTGVHARCRECGSTAIEFLPLGESSVGRT